MTAAEVQHKGGGMEQYFYKGQTHRIVARALDELGLDEAYLKWRLGYDKDAQVDFRPNRLAATEWFLICQVLHLDVNSIQYGYCRRIHRVRIGTAYELGQLVLPRTRQLKFMLQEVRASRRQSARWEAKHYGFRLRWRIRRRRWIGLAPSAITRLGAQMKSQWQLRDEVERLAIERRSFAEADNGPGMKVGLRTLLGPGSSDLGELNDNRIPI